MMVLIWWALLVEVAAGASQVSSSLCATKQTCHDCIQTVDCAWCSKPKKVEELQKCFNAGDISSLCHNDSVVNPQPQLTPLREHPLGMGEGGAAVQLSPQNMTLRLRLNKPVRIPVMFAQLKNYPVDLYYLMDLSKSMLEDKDKLSELGDKLTKKMKEITTNFRLGFGSFVDKIVMPYTSTEPGNLKKPCEGCAAPYGFLNHMELTTNTAKFKVEVENAQVSGNLDGPEGGFDALMQAVVCQEEIGWRDNARKLLVFSTDAPFHFAGDGKLGGVIKPNDGKCYLNKDGYYKESIQQDYPSIAQINWKVKENAINVIFAVTDDQSRVYEQLQTHVEGSTCGTLSNDSSNVVDLVQQQYDKITSSVEMKDTAPSTVKVTYYSKCLHGPLRQTSKCENLKGNSKVTFNVEVEVKSCTESSQERFQIYPVGISESLTVDLNVICSCPCEHTGHKGYVEKAAECSRVGISKCGVCECESGYSGRQCECGSSSSIKGSGSTASSVNCWPDNTTTSECSGRGTCICGQCQCDARPNQDESVSGVYCECDNFSCERSAGVVCAGPDHGACVCGKCVCTPGWTGIACDCPISSKGCFQPGGVEVCSGRGVCHCGQCQCSNSELYSGRYCEKCPTCPDRCEELKECVQCRVYNTRSQGGPDCPANCTFLIITENTVTAHEDLDETFCEEFDEINCYFAFVYSEQDNLVIRAQRERECPRQVFLWGIMVSVVIVIVVVVLLLLLLWKFITTIHDRREFSKFEHERALAKWNSGGNPLFKEATSTFRNPTYGATQVEGNDNPCIQ